MAVCSYSSGSAELIIWSLCDDYTWIQEKRVPFRLISERESYKKVGLESGEIPALGLLHAFDHDVLYFFTDRNLFSVELGSLETVECAPHHSANDAGGFLAQNSISIDICSWIHPPPPSMFQSSKSTGN